MPPDSFEDLRRHDLPRAKRPKCGAPTKGGVPCQAQALVSGRCVLHTPPEEAQAARETLQRLRDGKQFVTARLERRWQRWAVAKVAEEMQKFTRVSE